MEQENPLSINQVLRNIPFDTKQDQGIVREVFHQEETVGR